MSLFAGKEWRKIGTFAAITSVLFLLVISVAKTKLSWYELPVYPLLAILAACCLYTMYEAGMLRTQKTRTGIIACSFFLLVFYYPYLQIFERIKNPEIGPWETDNLNMAWFMKDAIAKKHNIDGYVLLWYGNGEQAMEFYLRVLKKKSIKVRQFTPQYVSEGDTIVAFNTDIKQQVGEKFETKKLRAYHGIDVYHVISRK